MKDYVFKKIATVLTPFIFMLGVYIILSGGSFPGGIILSLSFILYSTAFGLERGKGKLSDRLLYLTESFGTLWYFLIGLVGLMKGLPFLSNKIAGFYMSTPGSIFAGGMIALLGFGVGIRVTSTVVTLFFTMMEDEE